MEPFLGGGEMIADVFQDKSTYAEPPSRFEAGTPAIGEAIGLGAAIDYLTCIGMDQIHKYEKELGSYLYESLISVPNVWIYGPAPSQTDHRAPLCSFNVENVHPTDIAEILDQERFGQGIIVLRFCIGPLVSMQVPVQVFTFTIQKRRWMSSLMLLKLLLIFSRLNTSAVQFVSAPFLPVSSLPCLG